MEYRFHLQRGTAMNKSNCPACHGKRCFRRYVDEEGKVHFPDDVGRCDHENRCGYHYTPKQFFADHPDLKPENDGDTYINNNVLAHKVKVEPTSPSFVDSSIMQKGLTAYDTNPLFVFLRDKFGEANTKDLFLSYNVGTAKLWGGSTVFWQVDVQGKVRTGKIMQYDSNGHRVKKPVSRINWVHSILKLEDFHLQQCLFGEHLLASEPDKQVAIVESEKTAIIASFYLPQYLWLATGGKDICWHEEVLEVLRDRQVILFPDLKGTKDWRGKMQLLSKVGANPFLYGELERIATSEEREAGLDIADFLLRINPVEGIWEQMKKMQPALKILEEKLDLVLEGFGPA